MPNGIKNKVVNIIGFSNYRKLLTGSMRILNGVNKKIMSGDRVLETRKYAVKGKDSFFGYYDLQPINKEKTKLLTHVIDGNIAQIGYFDLHGGDFHKVSESNAWNWQMGSRLRWYEDDLSILFNDFDGEGFVSRVVDLNGNEIKRFPFPIFDIDFDRNFAYFTDFTVLHHLREGYGYSNLNVDFRNYYEAIENGLFRANLSTGEFENILPINEIAQYNHRDSMNHKYHYLNHITVNKRNGDVMFFHLWAENGSSWENRMVFVSADGELVNVIEDFDRASHYAWMDESHILVSVMVKGQAEYRLYNYRTGKFELMEGMKTDGHPSYLDNRYFVTDTYANRCAMQSIYLCDAKTHTYKNMFSVYHSPSKTGPERCDLHPRINDDLINIDSVAGETRSQYILKCDFEVRDSSEWQRRLVLNKNAEMPNEGPASNSLFSCMKSEYLFATGREKASLFKLLHMWFLGPTFRANVYICWMQKSKSMFKRKLIRNHLEMKYSIVVDQHCSIGLHFRSDHTVGIVFGPGAVIGDYVKIYQNVTLGQNNGKFPKIGNHVVIYPGAKIIGGITVGDYAVVGANAVVTKDVPVGATVAGVPAKVLKERYKCQV